MTKVYPNNTSSATLSPPPKPINSSNGDANSVVLTVWKKSLLFNCDGFTVFDSNGNLVFRVDNYIAGNKGEIVLMDASGNSLFTIRRKRLSLGDSWLVFEGEKDVNPRYTVRKRVNFLRSKSLALVTSGSCRETISSEKRNRVLYEIEGSYAQRCCAVYDDKRRLMAEIKQKEAAVRGVAFGMDVFRLIVHSESDLAVAMALVILLDQMFGSSTSPRR
ncbi:LURP-one-related 8 [Olea europaea subsp. europaea]|uniref:LURP-one-related 8 n=1 Tax=Olea europaea subsp. europaea TaxID=158383 RepID=A0A8S0UZ64_OLEEU|nr:LURP-one-related 8 [Olea europaea subsp. europaea]